jgi:hypothetical protein
LTNRLKKKEKKFSDSMPRHFPKEMAEAKRAFQNSNLAESRILIHGYTQTLGLLENKKKKKTLKTQIIQYTEA